MPQHIVELRDTSALRQLERLPAWIVAVVALGMTPHNHRLVAGKWAYTRVGVITHDDHEEFTPRRDGRIARAFELGWLLYPVLIAGGLKLLAEDLRGSRASMLFVALAFYGAALIVAPRLARTAKPIARDARTPAQQV